MPRKRPITSFGWVIKTKLAELKMNQNEFCQHYKIPECRLADIMTNRRKAIKYRKQIEKVLGIHDFPEQKAK